MRDTIGTLGLSTEEANRRLEEFGRNRLPEPPVPGPVVTFLRQFLSPFIYILLIAAIVSFVLGQLPSGIFIVAVLILNALIGTVQEYSAQRSAAALRNIVRGMAHVFRDGSVKLLDIEEVVPGDHVLLSSGDKVPADLHLVDSYNLAVDESMLTGESLAVSKNPKSVSASDAPISERTDCCFAGTIVTHGRAEGVVTATALETEIGHIARQVGRERVSEPPLMIRIRRFTYQVAAGIFFAILALTAIMLLRGGYNADAMILMAIGLAVSTIPEGLPAALTVALALGMGRMARLNVIIRKLVAVEALGSCTFICSDKTGTLTVNELTIRHALLPDGTDYVVTGEGVAPGGEIVGADDVNRLGELCITGVLANESQLDYAGGEWVSDGDIVDIAFLVFAKKLGLSLSEIRTQQQLELIPYESDRAYSGSLNMRDGKPQFYVKGSPEKMLEASTLMVGAEGPEPIARDHIVAQFEGLARQGYRIIALASRELPQGGGPIELQEMTFLGMVAMIDPLRPEARDAVVRCQRGGIGVAMVTGDHPATAKAIAEELGLCGSEDPAVTGPMIREASTRGVDALDQLVSSARVFARIEPQQKEQIVESFMRGGDYVAVTGDGVNDAPAMRRANVGIAMGRRGTDVAKEAADLIITDDNFSSIVDGIEQGRIVYNNIRKVIALLIATGFSALLLFFCAAVAGLPMPMIAVQLLWLNLVANGLQDVALAFEPKEGGELQQRPRRPTEPIFERAIIEHVLVSGTLMGGMSFAVYYTLMTGGTPIEEARNLTLMLMVLFGNIHALMSRSETRSIFQIRFFANPFLVFAVPIAQLVHIGAIYTPWIGETLQLYPVSFEDWSVLLLVASSLLLVEETHKAFRRRHDKSST